MELLAPPPWTNDTVTSASKKDIVVYLVDSRLQMRLQLLSLHKRNNQLAKTNPAGAPTAGHHGRRRAVPQEAQAQEAQAQATNQIE